jgi:hypothetical protein
MSHHQGRLPEEILTRVFQNVTPVDLRECFSVCQAWKVPAKLQFYKEINFIRFSSIGLFIKGMESCRDYSHLIVKKITFTCRDFRSSNHDSAFKQQFLQVMVLCPNIEWIGCSFQLTQHVLQALHSLPSPLKKLGVFPYAHVPEFTACAKSHSHSFKEYAVMDSFERPNIAELRSFPRLEKLSLVNGRVPMLEDLEGILKICRNLEYLSVRLLHKDEDDKYEPFTSEEKNANPQLEYPSMKRLMVRSLDKVVVFPPIIHEYHSPLSTVIICTHIITQTISTIAILDSCHT